MLGNRAFYFKECCVAERFLILISKILTVKLKGKIVSDSFVGKTFLKHINKVGNQILIKRDRKI